MLQLGLDISTQHSKLWVEVLRDKYKCEPDAIPNMRRGGDVSIVLKGICSVWEEFQDGIIWRAGNGLTIRFWMDK